MDILDKVVVFIYCILAFGIYLLIGLFRLPGRAWRKSRRLVARETRKMNWQQPLQKARRPLAVD